MNDYDPRDHVTHTKSVLYAWTFVILLNLIFFLISI